MSWARVVLPLVILALCVSACGSKNAAPPVPTPTPLPSISYAGAPITRDGLQMTGKVVGPSVDLAINGKFKPRFWTGVNLGSTIPGRQPGEVAAVRSDYDRWLNGMGALGVHLLRVYTILRPDFYDALYAYNTAHPTHPIYLIQG